MCGICGELRFDNTHPDFAAVSRMTDALAGAVPTAAGIFLTARWRLGIAVLP